MPGSRRDRPPRRKPGLPNLVQPGAGRARPRSTWTRRPTALRARGWVLRGSDGAHRVSGRRAACLPWPTGTLFWARHEAAEQPAPREGTHSPERRSWIPPFLASQFRDLDDYPQLPDTTAFRIMEVWNGQGTFCGAFDP